jgi:hypothetical protein
MTTMQLLTVADLCCCAVLGCGAGPAGWVDRFAGKPRKGSDILVQALEREGVDTGGQQDQHMGHAISFTWR